MTQRPHTPPQSTTGPRSRRPRSPEPAVAAPLPVGTAAICAHLVAGGDLADAPRVPDPLRDGALEQVRDCCRLRDTLRRTLGNADHLPDHLESEARRFGREAIAFGATLEDVHAARAAGAADAEAARG